MTKSEQKNYSFSYFTIIQRILFVGIYYNYIYYYSLYTKTQWYFQNILILAMVRYPFTQLSCIWYAGINIIVICSYNIKMKL